jgi:hypothetical protein
LPPLVPLTTTCCGPLVTGMPTRERNSTCPVDPMFRAWPSKVTDVKSILFIWSVVKFDEMVTPATPVGMLKLKVSVNAPPVIAVFPNMPVNEPSGAVAAKLIDWAAEAWVAAAASKAAAARAVARAVDFILHP